jgi:hypothetical protein
MHHFVGEYFLLEHPVFSETLHSPIYMCFLLAFVGHHATGRDGESQYSSQALIGKLGLT